MQRSLPGEKLARVMGAFFTLVLGAISLGALLAPLLYERTDLDTTIWAAGLGLPLLCLLGWPWLVKMDQANLAHLAEIKPRLLILQRASILAEASQAVLERLAGTAREVEVPAGVAVVTEGEPADAFYVIESGAMAVSSHGGADLPTDLPPLGEGEYFGEIGLLKHIARTATVTATEPSKVLRVDGEEFLEALTSASASTSLLEGARLRLSRTPTYAAAVEDDADDAASVEVTGAT
jgi:hypothetical protein